MYGFVLQVNVLLTLFDNPAEHKFLGMIRLSPTQSEFAICDDTGSISSTTSRFPLGPVQASESCDYNIPSVLGEDWREGVTQAEIAGATYAVSVSKMHTMHMDGAVYIVTLESLGGIEHEGSDHGSFSRRTKSVRKAGQTVSKQSFRLESVTGEDHDDMDDNKSESIVSSEYSDGDAISEAMRTIHQASAASGSNGSEGTHLALLPMKRTIWFAILLCIATMGIAVGLRVNTGLAADADFMSQLVGASRQWLVGNIMLAARALRMTSPCVLGNSTDLQNLLLGYTSNLQGYLNGIHFDSTGAPATINFVPLDDLENSPTAVEVVEPSLSSLSGTSHYASLWTAMQEYCLKTLLVAKFATNSTVQPAYGNWLTDLDFIHVNGANSFYKACTQASFYILDVAGLNFSANYQLIWFSIISIIVMLCFTIVMSRMTCKCPACGFAGYLSHNLRRSNSPFFFTTSLEPRLFVALIFAGKIQEYNDEVFAVLRSIPAKQLKAVLIHYENGMADLKEFSSTGYESSRTVEQSKKKRRKKQKEISIY